jgi:hypothetical protein
MNTRGKRFLCRSVVLAAAAATALLAGSAVSASAAPASTARWVAGDLHTHSYLADGSQPIPEVGRNAFGVYGLDFMANSEPGGKSTTNTIGAPFVSPIWRWITLADYSYPAIADLRDTYPERTVMQAVDWNAPTHDTASVGIVGAANEPGGVSGFEYRFDAADTDTSRANEGTKAITHVETFSFPIVAAPAGATESGNTVTITTIDPNHFTVGDTVIVAGVAVAGYNGSFPITAVTDKTVSYTATTTGLAASGGGTAAVKDTVTDAPAADFAKHNTTNADVLTAVNWLDDNYGDSSYLIVEHPSRQNLWHVGDLRAMNDAAPDVAFGMEGFPGRQASMARGDYGSYIAADGTVTTDSTKADTTLTNKARTYGGADFMTAQVGGVWDSLLGEGRHFWIFDNSDFHKYTSSYKDASGTTIGVQYYDFWPGQYAKTYVYEKKHSAQALVDGMRSGDVYDVNGDLINGLRFTAADGTHSATMGGTLNAKAGKTVTVTVAIRSPKVNQDGDPVKVNHVDLISGDVTGMIAPTSPDYTTKDTNATTKVAKTFTAHSWKVTNGWKTMTFKVKATKDMYFRLRGTNLKANTAGETDATGNPLMDSLGYTDFPNPVDGGLKADNVTPDLVHANDPDVAWSDLWFYSNPVFLNVK